MHHWKKTLFCSLKVCNLRKFLTSHVVRQNHHIKRMSNSCGTTCMASTLPICFLCLWIIVGYILPCSAAEQQRAVPKCMHRISFHTLLPIFWTNSSASGPYPKSREGEGEGGWVGGVVSMMHEAQAHILDMLQTWQSDLSLSQSHREGKKWREIKRGKELCFDMTLHRKEQICNVPSM